MNDRQQIIQEIENLRGSRVITYITSDRPGIVSMIDPTDLREIFDHIKDIPKDTKIDLYIYSRGGNSVTAWALANLIREHTKNFNVLVPYRAHSCATAIAIGSNEIVIGRMGELGPIDPTLSAIVDNKKVDVSTEDLSSYIAFLKDKFRITWQKYTVQAFTRIIVMVFMTQDLFDMFFKVSFNHLVNKGLINVKYFIHIVLSNSITVSNFQSNSASNASPSFPESIRISKIPKSSYAGDRC